MGEIEIEVRNRYKESERVIDTGSYREKIVKDCERWGGAERYVQLAIRIRLHPTL